MPLARFAPKAEAPPFTHNKIEFEWADEMDRYQEDHQEEDQDYSYFLVEVSYAPATKTEIAKSEVTIERHKAL